MRPRLFAATFLGLALVAGLLFLTRGRERQVAPPHEQSTPAAAPRSEALAPALPAEETDEVVPRRESVAPASEPSAPPVCVVLGRVVDEGDRPLAGARVRLYAYQEWAAGHDVPRLSSPYDQRGWEQTTDPAGAFRFETPAPTAGRQALTITPDDFHDSLRLFFGEGEPQRPGFRAGETDLGTLRLATTGAIRGFVFDADGRPLAGAELDVGPEPGVTLQRGAQADASGAFVVAHVKPGIHGVKVEAEGYLPEFLKPVAVEAGRYTEGVEFLLDRAPTISGRVVDEAGVPLQGAKIRGRPQSNGPSAGAKSAADGSFTLFLPQDEPHALEAELDGYESFGVRGRSKPHPPGAKDIEVVLGRGSMTRFRVVDAETGDPLRLDRGLTVTGRAVDAEGRPQPDADVQLTQDRNGAPTLSTTAADSGRFTISGVDPGMYLLEARAKTGALARIEGLRLRRSQKSTDVGDLVLLPGASVVGRVLTPPGVPPGGLTVYLDDWQDEVTCTTDSAGGFRFDGLAAGAHELLVNDVPGQLAEVEQEFDVIAGETKELVIDARTYGVCEVTLTVLLGDAVAGIQVELLLTPPGTTDTERTRLGNTDARGRVTGSVRAAGAAEVEVFTPGGMRVRHPTARIALEPRGTVAATVRFPVGSVSVVLPDDVVLPTRGRASLELRPEGQAWGLSARQALADEARTFLFEHCPAGAYSLTFELTDEEAPLVEVPLEGGRVRLKRQPAFTAEREVTIRDGARLTLDLR